MLKLLILLVLFLVFLAYRTWSGERAGYIARRWFGRYACSIIGHRRGRRVIKVGLGYESHCQLCGKAIAKADRDRPWHALPPVDGRSAELRALEAAATIGTQVPAAPRPGRTERAPGRRAALRRGERAERHETEGDRA